MGHLDPIEYVNFLFFMWKEATSRVEYLIYIYIYILPWREWNTLDTSCALEEETSVFGAMDEVNV